MCGTDLASFFPTCDDWIGFSIDSLMHPSIEFVPNSKVGFLLKRN